MTTGAVSTPYSELYDPVTNTSRAPVSQMSNMRIRPASVLLNDGRYVMVGGENQTPAGGLATMVIFDPITETFTDTGNTTIQGGDLMGILLRDGRALFDNGNPPGAALFDPTTNTLTEIQPLGGALHSSTLTLLTDGRVLIVGGLGSFGSLASAQLFVP